MPSSSKKFSVRDRRRRSKGVQSTEDILKKIADGSYDGEEEVAPESGGEWTPLASHPTFYDAFIQRLYTKAYRVPAQVPPAKSSHKTSDPKLTRVSQVGHTVADPGSSGSNDESDSKTRQRIGGNESGGGTAQFSNFDSLFSVVRDVKEIELEPAVTPEDEIAQAKEPTVRLDLPTEPPLQLPPAQEAPEAGSSLSARFTRRQKGIVLGGATLLILLFVFGGESPPAVPTEDTGNYLAKNADSKTREATLKALRSEALELIRSDVPLFYEGALNLLRQAFLYDDNDTEALGLFAETGGLALPETKDPDALIKEVRNAIARGRAKDPHASIFYRAESRSALAQGDLDAAKRFALSAAESDPTSGENFLLVGELYYRAKDVLSARSAVDEAVRLMPTSVRAQFYAAKIAYDQGDLARSRALGLEALKLNPIHPPSYLLLAAISQDSGQVPEAKGLFETAAKLARFGSKEQAAQSYANLGKMEISAGEQALANQHFAMARYYSEKVSDRMKVPGSIDAASGKTLKQMRKDEYGPEYFQEQGNGLIGQRKYREAERFLQAASLLNPKNSTSLLALAEVAEKTAQTYEDFQKVILLYERAIDRDPKKPAGYWRLGTLETDQFNFERAQNLLNQAAALAPQRFEPFAALGKHYFKRQDYKEAISYFSQAEKLNPSDSEVHYFAGMIRLLYGSDGAKDAQVIFYKAYSLDPQNYDALVEWLKLRVASFDKVSAIQFVSRLIQEEPNNANLYWALGEIYAANKEYRKSVGYYHRALDIDNRLSRVRMSLAKALEAIGELEKAVAEYRLASRLDRRNSDGFFKAAEILYNAKSYNQAEEILKFLIEVTPGYPGAQRLLSKVYQARNEKDPALAAMEREVASNPENVRFILELSELYLGYEKYEQAAAELTKVTNLPATSKAPEFLYDKIRAYLLLSRTYRAQNRLESAESVIRIALQIDNNDPELHRELGYVYYAQHRDKEGVREFETYLNRNPAARDGDAIRNLIKRMIIEE